MARVRKDVATFGSEWHPDLEWYAKAINALFQRAADERKSWRYLGGIHGFNEQTWLDYGVITAADALPPAAEREEMWNQCQHAGWFFLPWHRGYLAAFEEIIAATIEELGGPHEDWALPYWNYLDDTSDSSSDVPWAFLEPTLSDGTTQNPLATPARRTDRLGPVPWFPRDISLSASREKRYTAASRTLGFGGGVTLFSHFDEHTGAVEGDPHNSVHVMLGGIDAPVGFMSDPDLAGLDPIFWLHHCNIDRLWAAWLTNPVHQMESSAAWRNGPPEGFHMPDATGSIVAFTPDETLPEARLAPTYDDLTAGTGLGALPAGVGPLTGAEAMGARSSDQPPPPATLVGAANGLTIGDGPARAAVALDPAEVAPAGLEGPQRLFLNLEHVEGTSPSAVLNLRLTAKPQGAMPAGVESPVLVQSVALFGLAKASTKEDGKAGSGINVAVDITEAARQLAQQSGAPIGEIQVEIEQPQGLNLPPIKVGRISVYRQQED